jgi:ABC-type transport system involved in multi-copper enzyme maturation permease subunit
MKFLAVLKDSLREAVDTKVFYVMIGLSLLVALFTGTMTFTPKPAAKEFMTQATASLVIDSLDDLNPEDPQEVFRRIMEKNKGLYEVVEVGAMDDEPEGPDARYRVVLRMMPLPQKGAALSPEQTLEHIRSRFGAFDGLRLLTVTDVKPIPKPEGVSQRSPQEAYYEVDTTPAAATRRLWPHTWGLFLGNWKPAGDQAAPLGIQLFLIEQIMLGWIGASVTFLISVIITAFFIPNMLRKGTIDMLIVKPIARPMLLLYKYIGGLTFVLLNTAVAVTVVWATLGLRSGVWGPAIFWMIPILTFSFAILYAISTVFAVLTRSAIVAILVTIVIWAGLWVVSAMHGYVEKMRIEDKKRDVAEGERFEDGNFAKVVNGMHFVLPRRDDLDTLTTRLLVRDLLTANQIKAEKLDKSNVSWAESLGVSCAYIALLLGIACWRFSVKDY